MRIPQLSLIEERIVLLLADGWSRNEVAADVGLDERTVDWHLAQATRKLESASTLHDRVRRAVASRPPVPIASATAHDPGRKIQ